MEALNAWWQGLGEAARISLTIVALLVAAVVLERVLRVALRRAYLRRINRVSAELPAAEVARIKRQQTLGTMLESLIRYSVYGAVIVVLMAIISGGRASAVLGASLVVVVVGFSLQRILEDVIEGALLLFEGRLAVGDVITVHQNGGTGVVEEFTLRTTVLRTMSGDRVAIPNGGVTPFTRWTDGVRPYRLELIVRGLAAADRVRDLCRAEVQASTLLWADAPQVELVEPLELRDSELYRVVIVARAIPGLEERAAQLAGVLEALLRDQGELIGPVGTSQLQASSLDAWRSGLPVAAAR